MVQKIEGKMFGKNQMVVQISTADVFKFNKIAELCLDCLTL